MQKMRKHVSLETLRENDNLENKVNRIKIVNKTSLLSKMIIGF